MPAAQRPSDTATRPRKHLSRRLNSAIDAMLLRLPMPLVGALEPYVGLDKTEALADRVRRRATVLARAHPDAAQCILSHRDRIVMTLYHAASPRGCFSGWCDGSVISTDRGRHAGLGGVLMEPAGAIVGELKRRSEAAQAFDIEIEALIAVSMMSLEFGARQLNVHTDCKAVVQRWIRRRDDPRLEPLRRVAQGYESFRLKAVPRRHNPIAHRLSQAAIFA